MTKYVFAVILAGCVTVFTSCVHETRAASEPTGIPIEVRAPAVVERLESVSASGSIEGSETADVAFLVAGRVARVLVEEGQHVSKGQLLAELEPTDYQNALNAAAAQKAAAAAVSKRADAGPRKQELEQARIDFERWEDEYKRMKFLVERKSLPPNDFQKIEAAYNASKERYEMAQEGTRKEDREAATAQAHAADAQASEESKRLSDTRLVAPISGNVAMRKVDSGQTVAAGAAVFTIAELNPVKVRVGVPEAEIGKVHAGRHRGGFGTVARRTMLHRQSGDHRSCSRTGFAHLHGEAPRSQSRTCASVRHGCGSPDLRAHQNQVTDDPRRGGGARSTGRNHGFCLQRGAQACLRPQSGGRAAGRHRS